MGRLSSDFPNAQAVDAALKRANKAEVDVANLTTAMSGKVDYSAYQTETQNLQAQINQIITPVTQDAEVENARVGADGTSYQTLKLRLDSEVEKANSKNASDIIYNDTVVNLSYKIAPVFELGKYQSGTVQPVASDAHIRTVYPVRIIGGYDVEVTPSNSNLIFIIIWADVDGEYISSTGSRQTAYTFTPPSNARYAFIQETPADASASITPADANITIRQKTPLDDAKNLLDIRNANAAALLPLASFTNEYTYGYEVGRYQSGTVEKVDNDSWVRTTKPLLVSPEFPLKIAPATGTTYTLYQLDGDYKWVRENAYTDDRTITLHTATRFIVVGIKSSTETPITIATAENYKIYQDIESLKTLKKTSETNSAFNSSNFYYNNRIIDYKDSITPEFESGNYATGSVTPIDSDTYIRTKYPVQISQGYDVTVKPSNTNLIFNLFWADINGNWLGNTGARQTEHTYTPPVGTCYVYIREKLVDETATITPADANITIRQITPITEAKTFFDIRDAVSDALMPLESFKSQYIYGYEEGRYQSGTAEKVDNSAWVRTIKPLLVNPDIPLHVKPTANTGYTIYQLDGDYKWVKETANYSDERDVTLNAKARFVVIGIRSTGDDPITVGAVEDYEIKQNFSTLQDIKNKVDSMVDSTVPDYYEDNVNAALAKIKTNMGAVGKNGETFVFISDMHWDGNTKNSPRLIKYILDRTNIKDVISTGDLINEDTDKAAIMDVLMDCVKSFSINGNPLITTFGNHDNNGNFPPEVIAEHPEYLMTQAEVFSIMQKQLEDTVEFISDDCDFYYDKPTTKTRFLFIDTKVNGTSAVASIRAASEVLASTPAGWHIIIVVHQYKTADRYTTPAVGANALLVMADLYNARSSGSIPAYAFSVDYTNAQGKVSCMLAGHLHKDGEYTSPGGIPVILIDTDCGSRTAQTTYPYTPGTVTEQCFDVITIDYSTDTIKCVRVGRGINREISPEE